MIIKSKQHKKIEEIHTKVAILDYFDKWYVIPKRLKNQFEKDLYQLDEYDFNKKYDKYIKDGDLNSIDFYIKTEDL